MADAATQRKNMVESQVRPSDVTDRRILRAMLEIPREAFVPAGMKGLAYSDTEVGMPGAGRRALLAPRTFAKLIQLAAPEARDKVLDVGSLTGYSAAVLARLSASVIALESDAGLAAAARNACHGVEVKNVTVATGDLCAGVPDQGPYDVIVVEGAVDSAPERLLAQLAEGGRLVAILGDAPPQRAVLWRRRGSSWDETPGFDAAAPVLPGFEQRAAFRF